MIITTLKQKLSNHLFLFICANALYSVSTGIINILSPMILETSTYEEFIYIFQNIMFLTSLSTAGFIPTLLRYYKYDKEVYKTYYLTSIIIIIFILLAFSFWINNPLLALLKIEVNSFAENIIIFLSIIFSLLFIFNRGLYTAQSKYIAMTVNISIITIIRIVALFLIYYLHITSLSIILTLLCIIPFLGEISIFTKNLISTKWTNFKNYSTFLSFSFKISIVGVIYLLTNRLFVISTKDINDSLAASVSFAIGLVGIIHIINTSFNSYFIGKLDIRNYQDINNYIQKVKKTAPLFIFLLLILCMSVYLFVSNYYPTHPQESALISTITIFQSALISYLGLITLLSKTFNKLNLQLLLNCLCFISVFIFTKFIAHKYINSIYSYCIINIILLTFECILAYTLLKYFHKKSHF